MSENNSRVFSGDYSSDMWKRIRKAKTKKELRKALFYVCCRIQELESRIVYNYKRIEETVLENENE